MKQFTINYTGGGRPLPPITAKDHLAALKKSAKQSLGRTRVEKHCWFNEIDPEKFNRTYFIVDDGEEKRYFSIETI